MMILLHQQRYDILLRLVVLTSTVFFLLQLGVLGASLYSHNTVDYAEVKLVAS